jgi:two-component system response regulator HydG
MSAKQTILVVDDDQAHRTMLKTLLEGWGYAVAEADDGAPAIDRVKAEAFDLILLDIRMLTVSGIEALEKIKVLNPAIPVILMTAYSSVETAVDALKKGAYDYLTKPFDFEKLKLTIRRAMEHVSLKEENVKLKTQLDNRFDRRRIIGNSPAITQVLETVSQVAPSEATVLITGDSGTGKELIASAIHYNSPRKQSPFVKINCAAITETLLESELFGHEKGAFTGADRRKDGRFVQADKGTLFLDEVGTMPLSMQAKLLRVLQEREVTRVGGEKVLPVDVRVLAATNQDLKHMIQEGAFREDLYYRLNVVGIEIPPLNNRREDIPLLAQAFCTDLAAKNRKAIKGFTPQAMDRLIKYDWPGNVREMMNAIERAVVMAHSAYIEVEDLPDPIVAKESSAQINTDDRVVLENVSLREMEKKVILRTLLEVDNNKSEAARRLGITRKTLHKKLKEYGKMK